MKIFDFIICIVFIFMFSALSFSEEIFIPWDPDVAIADENIDINTKYNTQILKVFSHT